MAKAKAKMTRLAVKFGAPGKNLKGKRKLGVSGEMGLTANEYHALLAGGSVEVKLEIDPNVKKDMEGQELMESAYSDIEPLETVAEVGGIRLLVDAFSFTMTLPADLDSKPVDDFAYKAGILFCRRIGDSSESSGEGEE